MTIIGDLDDLYGEEGLRSTDGATSETDVARSTSVAKRVLVILGEWKEKSERMDRNAASGNVEMLSIVKGECLGVLREDDDPEEVADIELIFLSTISDATRAAAQRSARDPSFAYYLGGITAAVQMAVRMHARPDADPSDEGLHGLHLIPTT